MARTRSDKDFVKRQKEKALIKKRKHVLGAANKNAECHSEGKIYVAGYTRKDGRKVAGHCRVHAKPKAKLSHTQKVAQTLHKYD